MFKTKKELEALKNKYDKLQEELVYCQTETEALREQIEKMKTANGVPVNIAQAASTPLSLAGICMKC